MLVKKIENMGLWILGHEVEQKKEDDRVEQGQRGGFINLMEPEGNEVSNKP